MGDEIFSIETLTVDGHIKKGVYVPCHLHFNVTYLLEAVYLFLWGLLIIPAFIKPFSYSMAFYILADNPEMSANDAITQSRKMMDGYKWKLFCLHFSFIGWHILAVLTCGILYLWLAPYIQASVAEFYKDINRKNEKQQKVQKTVFSTLADFCFLCYN